MRSFFLLNFRVYLIVLYVYPAIEVLRSSGMTDKKLEELSRRGIPWVEVPADPDLYMSNKAWNIAEPLPVITSSLGVRMRIITL